MDSSSILRSSLTAYGVQLGAIANNIANANTAEFSPQRVVLAENQNGGVTATLSTNVNSDPPTPETLDTQAPPPLTSNVNMATQMVDLILVQNSFQASARALRTMEETKGFVLDIMG